MTATINPSINHGALAALDLGPKTLKKKIVAGEPHEAAVELFTSADGKTEIGVWECTPGRFRADHADDAELCYILSGSVTLHEPDGTETQYGAGDKFTIPLGWHGEWTVHSLTRKIYTIVIGG